MINLHVRMLQELAGIQPDIPGHHTDPHLIKPLQPAWAQLFKASLAYRARKGSFR